ncbi:homoserine dehydrogenase [Streptococcaceae bacterium ESL0687]|nr:homoserine dehydrogenase [Streptococcaceae bacterium ESL0687]
MVLNIGLLGFGTVAQGLPFLLEENKSKIEQAIGDSFAIKKVFVREAKKVSLEKDFDFNFVTDIEDIIQDPEIDLVVELLGRIEPAKSFIEQALKAKKHVVTANKDLLALHGPELTDLAEENGAFLYYEAAVAGGIPILRTLANSFNGDKITKLHGIINGTSNFMMTKMVDQGWSYDKALEIAQELGFAESDPTNDVDGIDAAYKLVILSQFAFGMTIDIDQISKAGIRNISPEDVATASKLGYVIKLLGTLEEVESGLFAEVSPVFLPKNHTLSSVNNEMNAIFVESIGIGQSMFYGPGAGQKPTATSVMSDLINIGQKLNQGAEVEPFNGFKRQTVLANQEDVSSMYYFALDVADQKGQMLKLSEIFNEVDISFDQVSQQKSDQGRARVVIITHEMTRKQLFEVTDKLKAVKDFELLNTFKVLGE